MKHHPFRRRFRFLLPVFVLLFLGVVTWAVHFLWNRVLVDVTGVKAITYWQALGLFVLAKILFGGFPGRGCCRRHWKDRLPDPSDPRWNSLTPEQREQMREEMRRRFGDWPRPSWCGGGDEAESKPSAKA